MRVKCLAQEHRTMSPVRAQTRTARSGVECTNHKATAPPKMTDDCCVFKFLRRSVDGKHLMCFQSGTSVFKFLRFSVDGILDLGSSENRAVEYKAKLKVTFSPKRLNSSSGRETLEMPALMIYSNSTITAIHTCTIYATVSLLVNTVWEFSVHD